MSPDTTPSMLGHALLALVHQRPSSGYNLRELFAGSLLHHFSSSPGAIYPALKRLEGAALIQGTTEQTETLRPRKVYRITPRGLEALRVWLERPVTREDVVSNIKELTLRFACMGTTWTTRPRSGSWTASSPSSPPLSPSWRSS